MEKIRAEWAEKWASHGERFLGVEGLRSKNAFYNDLADALNDQYKIRYGLAAASEKEIKDHTVRRVLEKGSARNFDDKTCDLLAVYLGYPNWAAYRMREYLPPSAPAKLRPTRKRIMWAALAGIALLALAAAGWQYSWRSGAIPADHERLKLVNTTAAKAPTKLVVHYDLRGMDPRQALIMCGTNSVIPQLEQGQITFEVLLAQAAPIQLFVANKLVCAIPVVIHSEGWEGYLSLRVPLEKTVFYHDGLLNFPANLIPEGEHEDYYPAFLNFRDYGLSADAMRFETRVMNNEKLGGQWAYDVSIDLVGTKHRAYFNVLAPNAVLYARAGAAETELSGSKNHDLKALGIRMDDWCVLAMEILSQEAVIFINGQEALRFNYREELGALHGIQFYLKGSGAVDWVRVTDLKSNKLKFFDDFLGEEAVSAR